MFYSSDDFNLVKKMDRLLKDKDKKEIKKLLAEGKSAQEILGYSHETMAKFYRSAYHLLERKEYVDASNAFTFLVTLNPYIEEYWLGLGMATQKYGDFDMAINAYEMAAVVRMDSPVPYFYLAKCFFAVHDRKNALDALDMALEYAGNHPEYRELRTQALVARDLLLES